jgi:hypothetical protein
MYASNDLSSGNMLEGDTSRDQSPRPISEMSSCWDEIEACGNGSQVRKRDNKDKVNIRFKV